MSNTPHSSKILKILGDRGGEIRDPSGQAVRMLMDLTGHRTTNALSGVLQRMQQEELIEREIAGRRTYAIRLKKPPDNPVIEPGISKRNVELEIRNIELKAINAALRAELAKVLRTRGSPQAT